MRSLTFFNQRLTTHRVVCVAVAPLRLPLKAAAPAAVEANLGGDAGTTAGKLETR